MSINIQMVYYTCIIHYRVGVESTKLKQLEITF